MISWYCWGERPKGPRRRQATWRMRLFTAVMMWGRLADGQAVESCISNKLRGRLSCVQSPGDLNLREIVVVLNFFTERIELGNGRYERFTYYGELNSGELDSRKHHRRIHVAALPSTPRPPDHPPGLLWQKWACARAAAPGGRTSGPSNGCAPHPRMGGNLGRLRERGDPSPGGGLPPASG